MKNEDEKNYPFSSNVIILRPWGIISQYVKNTSVTVNIILVKPNQRLSLQSHENRDELWVVLDNGTIIELEGSLLYPLPGEAIWIPRQSKHRLSARDQEIRVLEIAFGEYLLEDITRYEDDFKR